MTSFGPLEIAVIALGGLLACSTCLLGLLAQRLLASARERRSLLERLETYEEALQTISSIWLDSKEPYEDDTNQMAYVARNALRSTGALK